MTYCVEAAKKLQRGGEFPRVQIRLDDECQDGGLNGCD